MKLFWGILFLLSFYSISAVHAGDCDDSSKIYKICKDQAPKFTEALDRAKKNNKSLLVVFGADWCPWCVSLNKIFHSDKNKEKVSSKYEVFEVGLYAYDGREKIPSGIAILDQVKKMAQDNRKQNGIPILAVVNPAKNKAALINTGPLEKNTKTTKGHDEARVFDSIERVRSQL